MDDWKLMPREGPGVREVADAPASYLGILIAPARMAVAMEVNKTA